MDQQLPDLTDEERLGRTIVSRRAAKRATTRGAIDRDVFLVSQGTNAISVDRLDHAALEVMANLSELRAQSRRPPRSFHGWAVLTVNAARSGGRTVAATPMSENPYHADIRLNIDGKEVRDAQKAHALDLASRSRYLSAP